MNSNRPVETLNKAKALQNLFPDKLPQNFAVSFDPKAYKQDKALKIIHWVGHFSALPNVEEELKFLKPRFWDVYK